MNLFIKGNPRYLAGGGAAREVNYNSPPPTIETEQMRDLMTCDVGYFGSVKDALARAGQVVYKGKTGYHQERRHNVFLHSVMPGPSAGVEIEMVLKEPEDAFMRKACDDLESNWFHFERDGSLDPAHGGKYGFELITCPLPPDAYRNPRLWTGLQNLVNPWMKSFECKETGLHVHVGVDRFAKLAPIPLEHQLDRMRIGKMLATFVYYCVADQAFIDRVALRKTGGYCALPEIPVIARVSELVRTGTATGAALVDLCVSAYLNESNRWLEDVCSVTRYLNRGVNGVVPNINWTGTGNALAGHHIEINLEHPYTIEFRRGKGTLHALSIHRMVELMTSMVAFAEKLCREPKFIVTRDSFMDYIINTTKSEALKNLAKQTKG